MYVDNVYITAGYLIDDTFNDGTTGNAPGGWTVSGNATVAAVPNTNNKSVKFNDADAVNPVTADKTFPVLTGAMTVEYSLMSPDTPQLMGISLQDSSATMAVSVKFINGYLAYKDSSNNWVNLEPFTANKWYDIKIEADVQTDTFSLWVNGEREVSNQAFNVNVSSLSDLHFTTGNIPTGTMYVDNVFVTAG
jgi:hypothetical protein